MFPAGSISKRLLKFIVPMGRGEKFGTCETRHVRGSGGIPPEKFSFPQVDSGKFWH